MTPSRILSMLAGALALPLAAAAQPVNEAAPQPFDGAGARAQLFDLQGRKIEVIGLPGLSDENLAIIREALAISARDVPYYSAIAMAPDEGMTPESVVQASNFHSPAAAEAAALRACNGRRDGGAECVVAARTLPADYSPRPLQLSIDATRAFRDEYRPARAPKAMAISPATGKWAIARGDGAGDAAVSQCNAQAASLGAQDCYVAIAD